MHNGADWNAFSHADVSGQSDPYTITASGVANFSSFGVGSDDSLLPVELLAFTGSQQSDAIELVWQTASELNNDRFEIEHATNIEEFATRGVVAGAGTVNDLQTYGFSDEQPTKGTNYYRLKQIDYNGSFSYSHIIKVVFSAAYLNAFFVYPNPSSGLLKITSTLDLNQPIRLELLDMSGKTVWGQSLAKQNNQMFFDLSDLPRGYYLLKVISGSHIETQKIVRK